ncbi:hypothetical protein [Criblamydia sequanensis]|uniref:Uncharacterized protein n=1 Tax=Candidatus Criblamydia sequanensis CRIB-18 TaxID=1437425 RepID=A0A090D293_9BACT|nr:hypothetical protein [Criblamydia sequanensis]CDR34445.1 Conserved hypothetical protein [Criblamydia sequanensis CRIB-18]
MKNIAENNQIRFKNISRKKTGMFVNFIVTGIRGGTTYNASISVDMNAAEVDLSDSLEKIIDSCARIASKDIKEQPKYQFEGLQSI